MPLKSVTAVAPPALSIRKLECPRKVSRTVPAASAAGCNAAGIVRAGAIAIGKHCASADDAEPTAQSAAKAAATHRPIGPGRKSAKGRRGDNGDAPDRPTKLCAMIPCPPSDQDLAPGLLLASFGVSSL